MMGKTVAIQKLGQTLRLSPARCIFWEEEQLLLLSDLHIGKVAHFRKSGIAIPNQLFQEDINRLSGLVNAFKPRTILVTGDFFHSLANVEHQFLGEWRASLNDTKILLVRGNHEVLPDNAYVDLGIEVVGKEYHIPPFSFIHERPPLSNTEGYWFTGHIHPGIRFEGKGRQSLVLPCFHFAANHCVLPAFSRFTGKHLIEPGEGDQVYAIVDTGVDNMIIPMNT
jgi:DNA ligase-associated metallophosphoesterase